MLEWFRQRNAQTLRAKELYGAVVAAARRPAFYRHYGVPDTLSGRYEMIVLTLFQVLERLRVEGAAPQLGATLEETSRQTLEAFCTDMDDCMREMGVGDLSVPKKVKSAAGGFFERAAAYRPALEAGDAAALAAAIARFMARAEPGSGAAQGAGTAVDQARDGVSAGAVAVAPFAALADHAVCQRAALLAASIEDVLAGRAFLAPADVAGSVAAGATP